MKHTKGPWVITERTNWYDISDGYGFRVCSIDRSDEDYGLGDATLIAAAPSMYEALLKCKRLMESMDIKSYHEYEAIKSALATLTPPPDKNA